MVFTIRSLDEVTIVEKLFELYFFSPPYVGVTNKSVFEPLYIANDTKRQQRDFLRPLISATLDQRCVALSNRLYCTKGKDFVSKRESHTEKYPPTYLSCHFGSCIIVH